MKHVKQSVALNGASIAGFRRHRVPCSRPGKRMQPLGGPAFRARRASVRHTEASPKPSHSSATYRGWDGCEPGAPFRRTGTNARGDGLRGFRETGVRHTGTSNPNYESANPRAGYSKRDFVQARGDLRESTDFGLGKRS